MTPDDEEAYIRGRFAAAEVATDPCPHLVIEDVLPPELYRAMENDDPSNARWMIAAFAKTLRTKWEGCGWGRLPAAVYETIAAFPGENATLGLRVSQPVLNLMPSGRRLPGLAGPACRWQRKYFDALSTVNDCIEKALAIHADAYGDQLVAAGIFQERPRRVMLGNEFCLRLRGWKINPHVHDLGQAIQWMIYFPLPGSTEDQGTLFYRLTKNKKIAAVEIHHGTIPYEADEVDYRLTVPYRANTLIAFLNAPYAVHGTIEIPKMVARRYLFACNWWDATPRPVDIEVGPNLLRKAA